jgi:hypothetical protein
MSDRSLYDRDFYTWTQQQAELLQQVRDNRIDTEHLAEEVADLGKSQLHAVQRHIELVFVHLIKLAVSPADGPPNHWLSETRGHWRQLRRRFSPGMRQHLDLHEMWREAIQEANDALAGFGEPVVALDLPCPFTLDDLLSEDLDLVAAVDRVRRQIDAP